jgi:hypothetical protein
MLPLHAHLQLIPEVEYAELVQGLSESRAEEVKRRGALVVRGVVDEAQVHISATSIG